MTPEADINKHAVSLSTIEAIQYNLKIVPIFPVITHASAPRSEGEGWHLLGSQSIPEFWNEEVTSNSTIFSYEIN
jgi:hypothetical protein